MNGEYTTITKVTPIPIFWKQPTLKKTVLRIFIAAGFILVLLFVMLRYSNLTPFAFVRTQLVATAMTTASHQQIATIVAPESEIEAIMSNMLGEFVPGGYATHSDIQAIEITETSLCTEGFTFLEDGIYFREVSGPALHGQLMLILDPSRVVVATADIPGRQPANVRSMVASRNAIAGINGGWYNGFAPVGFVIAEGQRVYPPITTPHYESNTIVGFTHDDILIVGQFTEAEALQAGIRDSLHTYPILIINGEPQITTGDGGWGIAPRTAIGQRQDGAVLFLTIDGRQLNSVGATKRQVQDILLENNAYNAIGLDGGSSSAMYHRGQYLNRPSLGFERSVPTAFLVMY